MMPDYDLSPMPAVPMSTEAEQSVLGGLLRDNDAIDRIGDLKPDHFYDPEHARIFREVIRQIGAGQRCDVITVHEGMKDRPAPLPYLNAMAQNTPSAANIRRYADIVIDRAIKRGLIKLAGDLVAWCGGGEPSEAIADRAASTLEALGQNRVTSDPVLIRDMMTAHAEMMGRRLDGDEAVKPIATKIDDLDDALGGGLERGTLIVVAGRPAMGKTGFGLTVARNTSVDGVGAILSMEMPGAQISDRNVSAMGKIPLNWLKKPTDDPAMWDRMTHAYQRATQLNMYIDDQTALNMLQIRAKARQIKRKAGRLDCLVIDQLSFITGEESDNRAYELGKYTRGLTSLAKELDCAIVLLCQLGRKCESRPNKRPMVSDLAESGNIEQDAATIILLYRDEVYNPDSPDKGIAEIIIGKARQGETKTVAAAYVGDQTRFDNLVRGSWKPQDQREDQRPARGRGFGA